MPELRITLSVLFEKAEGFSVGHPFCKTVIQSDKGTSASLEAQYLVDSRGAFSNAASYDKDRKNH